MGKKKQFPTNKVSMGEEQEKPAEHAIVNAGFRDGKWLVLNNCHLSLEFMGQMEVVLNPKAKEVHEDFLLWITCQENPEFPLGLLQMATACHSTLHPEPSSMEWDPGRVT